MGYYPMADKVEKSKEILELILRAVEAGKPISFEYHPEFVHRARHQLRELLMSTQVFPSAAGGRYYGLQKAVKMRIEIEDNRAHILITPIAGMTGINSRKRTAPLDVQLERLKESTADIVEMRFHKDSLPDPEELRAGVAKVGYEIRGEPVEMTDDEVWYVAIRAPVERAASKFGFGKRNNA